MKKPKHKNITLVKVTQKLTWVRENSIYCFWVLIIHFFPSLSHVRLFATPWTVAYQALPSMGFSRQEYWSGLPFPSPGDIPNPGIEPGSPALQTDALPSEPPGKPENTEVGSQSLLQGIFPTQESNQGLLHCRRILYQLSYHGSHVNFNNFCQIWYPLLQRTFQMLQW